MTFNMKVEHNWPSAFISQPSSSLHLRHHRSNHHRPEGDAVLLSSYHELAAVDLHRLLVTGSVTAECLLPSYLTPGSPRPSFTAARLAPQWTSISHFSVDVCLSYSGSDNAGLSYSGSDNICLSYSSSVIVYLSHGPRRCRWPSRSGPIPVPLGQRPCHALHTAGQGA